MRLVGPLLLGLLFLAACDSNTAGTSGATVSDSAGVEVVSTSDEPAWAAEDAWYLADAPRLQLGTVEGGPRVQVRSDHGCRDPVGWTNRGGRHGIVGGQIVRRGIRPAVRPGEAMARGLCMFRARPRVSSSETPGG